VGQGFAQILHEKGDHLARRFGVQFQIVAVSDLLKGSLYNPAGLSPIDLLKAVQVAGHLKNLPAPYQDWDTIQTITQTNAEAIIEISYTDLATGEPALTHIRTALAHGKHVATTNKGPIALHYPELAALARSNGVEIGVEGTVMSGTPVLRLGRELLGGTTIRKVQGILNGTTNYILTQMENEATYGEALAQAQERGYAEADPTGDVEGHDAAGKVVILANLLMDAPLTMADVPCQGITGLTPRDIAEAKAAGERWKLVGTVERAGDNVQASVKPLRLPVSHPLASIGGATNAISYTTDLLGEVTMIGPGAGRLETGYALLGDLLAIHRKYERA
jgi:homoserine dehydrogenase